MIIDLSQPKICGLEAVRLYFKEKPDLEIIACTEDTDEISIHDALAEGVRVYVSKDEPVAYLASVHQNVQPRGSSINQRHLH